MGVVHEAVEYGVGVCGIANNFMPTVNGELGGNDRRAAPISFLKDFEEIVAGGGVERLQTPVIENEQIGAAKRAQEA